MRQGAALSFAAFLHLLFVFAAALYVAFSAGCFGDEGENCRKSAVPPVVTEAPLLVLSTTTIDFGSVVLNPVPPPVKTLTLKNEGTAPLQLYEVVLLPESDPAFQLASPFEGVSLQGGQSVSLGIAFAPIEQGPASGVLLLRSNDPEQPEVTVLLRGEGVLPPGNEVPLGECVSVTLQAAGVSDPQYAVLLEGDMLERGICYHLVFSVENPDPPDATVILHVRRDTEVSFDPEAEQYVEDASGEGVVVLTGEQVVSGTYYVLCENTTEVTVSFDLCVVLAPGGVAFRRGFLDGDDQTNFNDVFLLLNYLFLQGPEPSCLQAADTNGDCRLTISDASRLLRYFFDPAALGPPPYPFEQCGCPPEPCPLSCNSFPLCSEQGEILDR